MQTDIAITVDHCLSVDKVRVSGKCVLYKLWLK